MTLVIAADNLDLFNAFAHEHPWTKMADNETVIAIARRWERATQLIDEEAVKTVWTKETGTGRTMFIFVVQSAATEDFYHVDDDGCSCPDGNQGDAPYGWCKHRMSVWAFTYMRRPEPTQGPCQECLIADIFPNEHHCQEARQC